MIKNESERKTYYIKSNLLKALDLMSAYENENKSDIVNSALKCYIPQKYMKMADELIKNK